MQTLRSGASVQAGDRPTFYYEQARPEVAALVPPERHRVLEVGCAGGELGRLLRSRGHHVTGIELVPDMAERARPGSITPLPPMSRRTAFPFRPRRSTPSSSPMCWNISSIRGVCCARRSLCWPRMAWSWPAFPTYRISTCCAACCAAVGLPRARHSRPWPSAFLHPAHHPRTVRPGGFDVEHVGHVYRRTWWRELLCLLTAGRARALWTRQYLIVGRKRAGER